MGTAIIDARGSLVSISTLTPPVPPIVSGCIAYFKLGNNGSGGVSLVDSTGNGYGPSNNGATLGSAPFVGSSGSAQCQGGTFLDSNVAVPTNASYSVSCWVNNTNFSDSSHFLGEVFDNGFMFQSDLGGILFFSSGPSNPIPYTPLSDNTWYNVVGTFSGGTKTASLYINGSLVGTTTNPLGSGVAGFGIGARPNGDYPLEDGLLSEIGIWNRSLSANEVLALYNAGSGLTYPFTN
jgi:hypothetical protein